MQIITVGFTTTNIFSRQRWMNGCFSLHLIHGQILVREYKIRSICKVPSIPKQTVSNFFQAMKRSGLRMVGYFLLLGGLKQFWAPGKIYAMRRRIHAISRFIVAIGVYMADKRRF